jgi:hypothetical protein
MPSSGSRPLDERRRCAARSPRLVGDVASRSSFATGRSS